MWLSRYAMSFAFNTRRTLLTRQLTYLQYPYTAPRSRTTVEPIRSDHSLGHGMLPPPPLL